MAVERTCCGCRRRAAKSELIRFARVAPGRVALDAACTLQGRGAYLCAAIGCWEQAERRRSLARTLRTGLTSEQVAELKEEFVGYLGVANGEHQGS